MRELQNSLTQLAQYRDDCAGHSCIGAIVKIGINDVATGNVLPATEPFLKS